MNRFEWTWEIGGDGPDWFLELLFDEIDAPLLHSRVVRRLNHEFVWCREWNGAQRWMSHDSSFSSYLTVHLFPSRLLFERGWGYHGKCDADFGFLERLLGDGELPLQRWRVEAGGQGYGHVCIDGGLGLDDFAAYCRGEIEDEPSPKEIEDVVRFLVEAPELDGEYRLGEATIQRERLDFPVTHVLPITNDEWSARISEFHAVFRRLTVEICDVCHVRTSSSFYHNANQVAVSGSISVQLRST